MKFPIVHEIPYCDPSRVFTQFVNLPHILFLDSSRNVSGLGRYSFIAADPFHVLSSKDKEIHLDGELMHGNPFDVLSDLLQQYSLPAQVGLPPFQGGAAGLFSYDLVHHLENITKAKNDDMNFPDLLVGFYDCVIAFDHELERAWVFSSGFSENSEEKRGERAQKRLQLFLEMMEVPVEVEFSKETILASDITSNFSEKEYVNVVSKVVDYIYAGDIFEANVSQRFQFELPSNLSKYELYMRLRHVNPAPFSAYLDAGEYAICSASPERFIKLNAGRVETRPIKGTRPRSSDPQKDAELGQELVNSEKDRAENIMIVDLMRNDLSRVCLDESIEVRQLCGLETYATVHHLVSSVEGTLKPGKNAIDLLKCSFPGGSITGAPKVRAMDIIYELETVQRGPYCGSMGYIGFNGFMDTSILIRTFAIHNNFATVHAGGAVVSDSDPKGEYTETLDKVFAMKKTLTEQVEAL